ncbi:hypothetical protein YYC_04778 [Plasmodium yoelii 17X]|uniref:YIR protein n=1 Tax=Plasmodium yoelii 17X TaxID=1323249 RepID=V7PGU5_PLAYE|nr:hypothetical protein YYC_04778 [Plasmodium yoelii 17X]
MDKNVCKTFQDVKEWFLGKLGSNGDYQIIHVEDLEKYCINECDTNLDKINAGCLYLLDQFYKHDGIFPSPSNSNPNIVDNIFIWLSYMLNLNKTNNHDNMQYFYSNYIEQRNTYKTNINDLTGYDNYKDLIDERKDLLDMDSNIVSEFYEAFKLLCNLYNELGNNKNCENYLEDNEFLKKYEKLKNDSDITGNELYNQLLSTLLKDYDDSELTFGQDSEQDVYNSDVASSSSSIVSKLIPVLLIFGTISIFLGISYKYSLFGFRKRSQKHLREKLKK